MKVIAAGQWMILGCRFNMVSHRAGAWCKARRLWQFFRNQRVASFRRKKWEFRLRSRKFAATARSSGARVLFAWFAATRATSSVKA